MLSELNQKTGDLEMQQKELASARKETEEYRALNENFKHRLADFKDLAVQKDLELSKLLAERDSLEKQVERLQQDTEQQLEALQKAEKDLATQSQELNSQYKDNNALSAKVKLLEARNKEIVRSKMGKTDLGLLFPEEARVESSARQVKLEVILFRSMTINAHEVLGSTQTQLEQLKKQLVRMQDL